MNEIDHIGIAVLNLKRSSELYSKLLGRDSYKQERVAAENVNVAFFNAGESKVELLEASSSESTVAAFIARRGEGLHHVAFKVADIVAEMKRLKYNGFRLLSDEPRVGADNKLVCFVHPKDSNGVLIEICQDIIDDVQ